MLGPPADAAEVAAAAAVVAETAATSLPLPMATVSTTAPGVTAPASMTAAAAAIDFSALSWRFLEEWKGEGSPGRLSAPLPYQEQMPGTAAGKRSIDVANSDRRTFVATHSLYNRVPGGSKAVPTPVVVGTTPGAGVGAVGGVGGAKGNGTVAAAAAAAETGMLPVGLPALPVSTSPATGKGASKRPRSSSAAERCVAVCLRVLWRGEGGG